MSPYITKHRENKYVQEDMRSYPLIHNFIPALKELGELPDPHVASEGEDRGKWGTVSPVNLYGCGIALVASAVLCERNSHFLVEKTSFQHHKTFS